MATKKVAGKKTPGTKKVVVYYHQGDHPEQGTIWGNADGSIPCADNETE